MKKLFNLSLALSVFASPLFLTSCEDEDTDNKEQIISEEKDQTYNIQPGVSVSSIKAYAGDTYVIDNEALGITGVSVSIVKVVITQHIIFAPQIDCKDIGTTFGYLSQSALMNPFLI